MRIRRKTKHGLNTLIAILLFIGVLALVNFLSNRHHLRHDLTETGIFSLADQTVKILEGLDREVAVYAFFQVPDHRLEDLLNEYKLVSGRFQFEFIDPDQEPERAKAYDIRQYGTVVVKSGESEEQLTDVTEEKLTNAILKVSRDQKKVIYFLQGHDERDIENIERDGYNAAKKALEEENYSVSPLMLAGENEIPGDCAALVVASPRVAPFEDELEKIGRYLEGGGSLLFLLDPYPAVGLETFLGRWGVKVGDDVVVDASGVGRLFGAGPTIPLVSDYPSHAITKDFNVMTFFPLARSVSTQKPESGGPSPQAILKTSNRSWAESNYRAKPFQLDKDDIKGPVTIAVAMTKTIGAEKDTVPAGETPEEKSQSARMVVVGDSDFACNSYFSASGNSDLFLNVMNWLAEEEDLISIRPKTPDDRRVTMTAAQSRYVFYLAVIVMPLIVVIAGVIVKIRRR